MATCLHEEFQEKTILPATKRRAQAGHQLGGGPVSIRAATDPPSPQGRGPTPWCRHAEHRDYVDQPASCGFRATPEHLEKKKERRGESIKARTRPQPSLRTRSPREGELPTAPHVSASVPLPLTCLRLMPALNSAFTLLVRFHFWLFRE